MRLGMLHAMSGRLAGALGLLALALAVLHPAAAQQPAPKAGEYDLDTAHAALLWKVNHLGFADYIGRYNAFDATLRLDPSKPEATRLSVVIDAASLDVNNPEFETKLRGADWFDTQTHPEIRFESTSVRRTGPDTGTVTGDLTLLGVTRPATLDVTLTGQGTHISSGRYTLGFRASGVVDRTKFGLDNYVPLVGSDVTLEIHAEFTQAEKAAAN